MSYAYSYLPTGQDKLPPRSYHKWNMDVKLPQGGQWINPEVPTQFVVEKCTDCGLRIVFCLGQNEQYFFPNNSKCSMSYSSRKSLVPRLKNRRSRKLEEMYR